MSKKHDILELNVNLKDMSETLERLRKDKKMTQPELGVLIGYDKATISACENGHSLPKTEVLIRLSDYYKVSINYLLGKTKYRHQEIEDIGKPLGLSDKSVCALLFMSGNEYKDFSKREFGDYKEMMTSEDYKIHSNIMEIINLSLEQLYDDIIESKKEGYRHLFKDTIYDDVYKYIHSDYFVRMKCEGSDEIHFSYNPEKGRKQYMTIEYEGKEDTVSVGEFNRFEARNGIIDKLFKKLEKIRIGGLKDGKHKTKRK